MADQKISDMTAVSTPLIGTEVLPCVQSGNKKVTVLQLKGYTSPSATDSAPGIVELATNAETVTGTDATRAVTPASLQAKVDSLDAQDISGGGFTWNRTNKTLTAGETNNTNNGNFGSALFGELSEIDTGVGAALSAGENNYIGQYGGIALGRGCSVKAGGGYSHIGGLYTPSSISGKTNLKAPQVSAQGSFGYYATDGSQTDNHGLNAAQSAICGGLNPNIPSTSPRCFIGAGNGIKADASTPDTAYFPKMRIGKGTGGAIPSGSSSVNLLVRNTSTSEVEERLINSIMTATGSLTAENDDNLSIELAAFPATLGVINNMRTRIAELENILVTVFGLPAS